MEALGWWFSPPVSRPLGPSVFALVMNKEDKDPGSAIAPVQGKDLESNAAVEGQELAMPEGWRGDEHRELVQAAKEAGLPAKKTELDLFTKAFAASTVLDDPQDHAIVVRGRTTLTDKELLKCLYPTLRFLRLGKDDVVARVYDGGFELRVSARAARIAPSNIGHAKVALQIMLGAGLFGWACMEIAQWITALLWAAGLLTAGWVLRRGLVSGRAILGARLASSLGILAQEEGLILPEAGAGQQN